jgi:hypothetical protein
MKIHLRVWRSSSKLLTALIVLQAGRIAHDVENGVSSATCRYSYTLDCPNHVDLPVKQACKP